MLVDTLVMLRSGHEYKLTLTPAQVEELMSHKDIGPGRVYVIGQSVKTESDPIPWNKMFPGIRLYRTQAEVPKKPRTYTRQDKTRVMFAAEPWGYVGYMGAVDLHKPTYHIPISF